MSGAKEAVAADSPERTTVPRRLQPHTRVRDRQTADEQHEQQQRVVEVVARRLSQESVYEC